MAQDFGSGIYGLKNPFDTPERKAFREIIENFVAAEIRPHVFDWDEAGHVPWELHEKLGALGIWGFGIDEKYGGLGFDDPFMRIDVAVALAMCGAGGVAAAVGGRSISLDPIQKLSHDDIRTRVLPEIISGPKRQLAWHHGTRCGFGRCEPNNHCAARGRGMDY